MWFSAILLVVGLACFFWERRAARLAGWYPSVRSPNLLPAAAVTCLGIFGLLASVNWALAGGFFVASLYGLYRLAETK